MSKIIIHQELATDKAALLELCPFNAICVKNDVIGITAACKMCKICVNKGPKGVFEYLEEKLVLINKDEWKGIVVYVDHTDGEIHPVTYELIGKAEEMAKKLKQSVYCLFMGYNIRDKAEELLYYGVDEVLVYDDIELKYFRIEPYVNVFEDFINRRKPTIVLVGGTGVGRSLAPRAAARFRTGLTADCTSLEVQINTDLDQIRPAFGGNIMAHIHTPNHRPQFATVRYKIFSPPAKTEEKKGIIIDCFISKTRLASQIKVLSIRGKEKTENLEDAEVIIVAGRAIKKQQDLEMIYQLADLIGAQVAGTRPLIEAGWIDPRRQIGLSGRTVKPKLIITCGVSGAIQFVAGMNNSDCIVAINQDENASIFNVAHYCIVGEVYEVVNGMIENLKRQGEAV